MFAESITIKSNKISENVERVKLGSGLLWKCSNKIKDPYNLPQKFYYI